MVFWAGCTAVLSAVAILLLEPWLRRRVPAPFQAQNFRQKQVPITGGALLATAFLLSQAELAVFVPDLAAFTQENLGLVAAVLGLFIFGTVDDLIKSEGAEGAQSRGFRGHLSALARGRITGGIVKMAGGGAVALLAGALWETTFIAAVIDGLLVALAANLMNLLDLRPGRAGKVFLIWWVPLAVAGWNHPYIALSGSIFGACVAWIRADLTESGMLGDGGANLLGAVVGAGLALLLPPAGKLLALVCLIALTAVSEVVSFTKTIDRVPPLRWIDRLGRAKS